MKHTLRNITSVVSAIILISFMGASNPQSENAVEMEAAMPAPAQAQELWLETLMTDTPQEGRELAIKLARRSIAAIQTDPEVRKQLRSDYDKDTEQLIMSAQVIAIEFQTIAAANNYWRD